MIKARIASLNETERELLYGFIGCIKPKKSPLNVEEYAILYIGMGLMPKSVLGSSANELQTFAKKQNIDLNNLKNKLMQILVKISPPSQPD